MSVDRRGFLGSLGALLALGSTARPATGPCALTEPATDSAPRLAMNVEMFVDGCRVRDLRTVTWQCEHGEGRLVYRIQCETLRPIANANPGNWHELLICDHGGKFKGRMILNGIMRTAEAGAVITDEYEFVGELWRIS